MTMRFTMQLLEMLQTIKLKHSAQLVSNGSFNFSKGPVATELAGYQPQQQTSLREPSACAEQHSFPTEPSSSCESFSNTQLPDPSQHPCSELHIVQLWCSQHASSLCPSSDITVSHCNPRYHRSGVLALCSGQ